MKDFFQKYFSHLIIFNKKLKHLNVVCHKNGFDIKDEEFRFYLKWDRGNQVPYCLKFAFRNATVFYIFDNSLSVEKNIEAFYTQYLTEINEIIINLNEENDGLDKVKQNNKRIIEELESNCKLSILV